MRISGIGRWWGAAKADLCVSEVSRVLSLKALSLKNGKRKPRRQVPIPKMILLAAGIAAVEVMTASQQAVAQERPYRGAIPWTFIVCQFAGDPDPDMAKIKAKIGPGNQSLADYVHAMSNGIANLDGSSLIGPVKQKNTATQEAAIDHSDGQGGSEQIINDCLNTFQFVPASSQHYYVLTTTQLELKGFEYSHALGGIATPLPEMAHEFGHGIGLEHSWSNDTKWSGCGGPAAPNGGDYGNKYDLMSAACIFTSADGNAPVYLDAHHLDEMGWIPQSKAVTFGADGSTSKTYTIAALSHPETKGPLIVRVPFDINDPHHYYTIEFRKKDGWDAVIPADIVLINEIKPNGQYYQTTLLRDTKPPFGGQNTGAPLQSLSANGVSISVGKISGNQASVTVSSTFAQQCMPGYVYRNAGIPAGGDLPTEAVDNVCVTPAQAQAAAQQNAERAARGTNPSSTQCYAGYVYRLAYPGDHSCVTPQEQQETAQENAQGPANSNPAQYVYGPNTCMSGYVWRSADDSDYVCVTQATQQQVKADNETAPSRKGSGSAVCKSGYVRREAFPGDNVCVTPARNAQAQQDNAQANARLQTPNA